MKALVVGGAGYIGSVVIRRSSGGRTSTWLRQAAPRRTAPGHCSMPSPSTRSRPWCCPPPRPPHLICNLGNGDGYSVRQVLSAVAEVTGRPVPHSVGPRRAGDPTRLVASADRARDRVGWTPELTVRDMVADAWEFATTGSTIR